MRFGLIGCGHIAKKHCRCLTKIPTAELTALCDLSPERARALAPKNATIYTNFQTLLQSELDVVIIATPSGLHKEMVLAAAAAKKHILVEKPMALNAEETKEMLHACKAANVKLAVVHPNRFRPAMQVVQQQLTAGNFGKLGYAKASVLWYRGQEYYDQANWRGTHAMDGGVLLNQAIHSLDLLTWLLGEVEEVQAQFSTRVRQIEAEETALAFLKFKSGLLGLLEATVTAYPKNFAETIAIFGDEGAAVISGPTATGITRWEFAKATKKPVLPKQDGDEGLLAIIANLILAIKEDHTPIVSGLDGHQVLAIASAINQSAKQNMVVKVKY
ncbi:MAG: hypothetical protein RLZ12_13 [Bacillota bacterium]|jgi:predicted dehydrogenase